MSQKDYPLHPGQTTPRPYYVEIPLETFETMSEELAELRKHELAWDLDKARIKELEAENESLKYSVATLDTDLAMLKRWRKFPEEKPIWGKEVLVVDDERKQYIVRFSHDMKWISWGKMSTCESNCVKFWMQLPEAPEDK